MEASGKASETEGKRGRRFLREAPGCGLRRCEGPEGGAVLATAEAEAEAVGQRRKVRGAALGMGGGGASWRQPGIPVTAPAQASSRAQTPTSPGSSPPFPTSASRLRYPEIKAMVIRVRGGGGLT